MFLEIKKKLTVTKGARVGGGDNRGKVKSRNMYKGHMDKDNGVGDQVEDWMWEGRWEGQGRVMEENGDNYN